MSAIKPWADIVYSRPPSSCQVGHKWDQSSGACMTLSDYQFRGGILATMNGLGDVQIPGIPFTIPGISLPSTTPAWGTVDPLEAARAMAGATKRQPIYMNPWVQGGALAVLLVILARRK